MSNPTQMVVLPGTRKIGIGPLPSFVKPASDDPDLELKQTIKAVLNAKKIAVVVGAGISTAANIPDFRSSTGLFASLKARFPNARLSSGRDLFDVNAWKDPNTLSLHLGMLAELHKMCGAAQPTAFHQFLKQLDDDGRLSRVYTQNIDGLEEKAGLSYGVPDTEENFRSSASSSSRTRSDPNTTPQKPNLKRKRGQVFPSNMPPTPRSTPPPPNQPGEPTAQDAKSNDIPNAQRASSVTSSLLSEPTSNAPSSQSSLASTVFPDASLVTSPRQINCPALTRSKAAAQALATKPNPRPVKSKPIDPFPRVIPLHGTLKNLSCPTCKHSVLMSDYIGPLAEGEMIHCPQCQSFDDARAISGFRTRGVSLLKSGVVLYGEEHSEGEKVGAVTSRDLMRGRRPDLLIVAGTSLKVPGTKRLVKELSKVIKPPSKLAKDSDDEEDPLEEDEESASRFRKKPKPVHTIFLNNEFPAPCGIWKDTFDVWVKGNVDQFIKMVEDEKNNQEEIKIKKAQEKIEREKKKEEKMQRALSQQQTDSIEKLQDGSNGAQVSKPSTPQRPNKPRIILKLSQPKESDQSQLKPKDVKTNTKNKGSVSGFFKTGKAAVVSVPNNPASLHNSKKIIGNQTEKVGKVIIGGNNAIGRARKKGGKV